MNPIVYLIIRSIVEEDNNKAQTFVYSKDSALEALATYKNWQSIWKGCTITVERVVYLQSIKSFSTATIEYSELVKAAKEESDKEVEPS